MKAALASASMDWGEIFGLSVSPWELIIRGTAMYLFLFVVFRVVIRRRIGAVGMADILILVIIADAAQNGMSGEYRSVTEGAILIGTIIFWNVLIDWLNYRVPALQDWLEAPPMLLVRDGRILHRNMRHEFITEQELKSKLREKGVDDLSQVAQAHMESDGSVSVIKR
ncbi:MAG TPA: YetF domain-containing protein [Burkholderiales bacterium]|nr:YetF domain-containing protein [Burkholderiales bacterium]